MYEPRLIHLQWLIETIQAKDTINCTVGDKILSKQALSYLQIKKANMYLSRKTFKFVLENFCVDVSMKQK